ncbi:hypothetical protein [Longitalea luteola]|uniref:hypothetical protein n=1 Tax=Longitalea luteola TaxID=2812563 RepID=UPI001A96BFA2|nr:hypothetical protein [Longitalea luteola]
MYVRILFALLAISSYCYVAASPDYGDPLPTQRSVDTPKGQQAPTDTGKVAASTGSPLTFSKAGNKVDTAHSMQSTIKEQARKLQQLQQEKDSFTRTMRITAVMIIALLALLILQHLKLKKMADQQAVREKMIESYTQGVDSLYNYLVDKGLLRIETIHDSPLKIKIAKIKERIIELIDKYLNEDARNASISADTDHVRNKLKQVMEENFELTKKLQQNETNNPPVTNIQFVPHVAPERRSHIKTEIMVSAGPRKEENHTDTELGEDVAGMLSLPRQTFFWLMDGTSDNVKLTDGPTTSHIFSSRLLAQSIGQYIQKHITQCFSDKITLNTLLEQARNHVQQEWVQRINALPAEKKLAIKQLIQDGMKPLCSTTAIIGRLTEDGHLHVLRAGDSKVFPFIQHNGEGTVLHKDFKFSKDPTHDNDRIAFRLDYSAENDAFQIVFNNTAWAIESAENISLAFVFTDGIGRVVETQLNSNNPGIAEVIKHNIARIPQKTYDDKTLIVLERLINP